MTWDLIKCIKGTVTQEAVLPPEGDGDIAEAATPKNHTAHITKKGLEGKAWAKSNLNIQNLDIQAFT